MAIAPLDLVWGFPGYRCLKGEYFLAGVVAIHEAVAVFHGQPFNGSETTFFYIPLVKALPCLLELSSGVAVQIPAQ